MASFSRGPAGGKFANKNLNAAVGVKTARGVGGKTVPSQRGTLLFISDNTKRVAKPIGTAAAPAPVALNTPSIRKENNGKDISVNLVPVGVSSVWGQSESDAKKEESMAEQQQLAQQQAQAPQAPAPSVAPWAKKENTSAAGEGSQLAPPAGSGSSPQHKPRNWVDINDEEEMSRADYDQEVC